MNPTESNVTVLYPQSAHITIKTGENLIHDRPKTSSNFIVPQGKRSSITLFWLIVLSIYIMNLSNLTTSYTFSNRLIFLFFIFIAFSAITIPISITASKYPHKYLLFLLYSLILIQLILTDSTIYTSFTTTSSSPISSLQLLILPSIIFILILDKNLYLLVSISAALLSLGLLINSSNELSRTLLEFFVLIIVIIFGYLSQRCDFVRVQRPNDPNVTPLEEILDTLLTTNEALGRTAGRCGFHQNEFKEASEKILSVITRLQTCKNIYATQLEQLTKNMDEEDKVYIEQNAHESLSLCSLEGAIPLNRRSRSESIVHVHKLSGLLAQMGRDWNFNTFFLKECTEDSPLEVAGIYTLSRYKLSQDFSLNETNLTEFLKDLEAKYLPNPYHNSCHATDVMNSYLFFISNSDLLMHCTNIELLAGIISALGHDVGHPAKNNRFLVMTKHTIAIQYNDYSVLENMHSRMLFESIQSSSVLELMPSDQWCMFRKITIEMILATDMSKHFDLLETFKTKYASGADIEKADVRLELFKMVIKAADIGHAAKTIDLHMKWCTQVIEEFFMQGDQEKALGIPVSMYCDRETTVIGKSQAGFIKNIVLPLFVGLNNVLGSESIQKMCIQQLEENKIYWENSIIRRRKYTFEEEVEEKVEKQKFMFRKRSSFSMITS